MKEYISYLSLFSLFFSFQINAALFDTPTSYEKEEELFDILDTSDETCMFPMELRVSKDSPLYQSPKSFHFIENFTLEVDQERQYLSITRDDSHQSEQVPLQYPLIKTKHGKSRSPEHPINTFLKTRTLSFLNVIKMLDEYEKKQFDRALKKLNFPFVLKTFDINSSEVSLFPFYGIYYSFHFKLSNDFERFHIKCYNKKIYERILLPPFIIDKLKQQFRENNNLTLTNVLTLIFSHNTIKNNYIQILKNAGHQLYISDGTF